MIIKADTLVWQSSQFNKQAPVITHLEPTCILCMFCVFDYVLACYCCVLFFFFFLGTRSGFADNISSVFRSDWIWLEGLASPAAVADPRNEDSKYTGLDLFDEKT